MKLKMPFTLFFSMVALAVLGRIVPHPFNFTPISAMALFGAAYFSRRWLAFGLPLVAMFLSDLFLNNVVYKSWYPEFYQNFVWFANPSVYFSFVLVGILGFVALRNADKSPLRLGVTSLGAAVLFFLLTNFATWQGSTMYTQDLAGLTTCYIAGLPFFGNAILGDLFYVGLLFGTFEYAKSRNNQLSLI